MSIAYYRKYRPQKFMEIVGQEHVVKILQKTINNDKKSHAYLFAGPKGSGKTSIAKIFAKTINCIDRSGHEACGKCVLCLDKSQIDIIEIDAASNRGIDEIREIRNKCNILPVFGKYKIYIIDEVQMLTKEAFNAFLKTLEEPPPHVIFILATTEANKIPLTIISRTQRFDFKKIEHQKIFNHIKKIAQNEKLKIPEDVIDLLAGYADGSMRDALSLLDQISNLDQINLADVTRITGITNDQIINKIENYMVTNSEKKLEILLDDIIDLNYDVLYIIKKLIISEENKIKRMGNNYVGIKKSIDLINSYNNIYLAVKSSPVPSIMFKTLILNLFLESNHIIIDIKEQKNNSISNNDKINNISIIINNALATAKKEYLLQYNKIINDNYDVFLIDNAKSNIKLAIAGEENLIFEVKNKAMLIQLNKNSVKIKQKLKKILKTNVEIIFVSSEKLIYIKEFYINNKENIKFSAENHFTNKIKQEFKEIVETED